MLLINFFHRAVVCSAIPEMSKVDAGTANAITASAVKSIPFKDIRNWAIVLLLLISNLPLFAYIFFGHVLAAAFTTSDNLIFIALFILFLALWPICWSLVLRLVRPEVLALLTQQKVV